MAWKFQVELVGWPVIFALLALKVVVSLIIYLCFLGVNMEGAYILLWCLICKDATPHTITNPQCLRCRDKDRQDLESTLDRFREAEGDPDLGDIFDAGGD